MMKFSTHGKNGFSQELIDQLAPEDKELSFLCGYVSLNPVFTTKVKEEVPRYTRGRFENVTEPGYNKLLSTTIPKNELKSLRNGNQFKMSYFKTNDTKVKDRLKIKDYHICNSLTYCSPWLNKYDKNFKNRGKVYTSVYVMFQDEKRLLTQECEKRFGYITYPFCATATVLFPPTKCDEIWTVGWIKALTKSDSDVEYGENAK